MFLEITNSRLNVIENMCIFVIITVLADGLAPSHARTPTDTCTMKCREFASTVVTKYRSHYSDVIMGAMASQITSLAIVYSTAYSGADQRKHQISASLAYGWGIHPWPVNSPHKWPVTRKIFPFDDVIMPLICVPAFVGSVDRTKLKFKLEIDNWL